MTDAPGPLMLARLLCASALHARLVLPLPVIINHRLMTI